MTDLPPPPVPANCDLRSFPFLPLDVVRLRDSRLSATATGDEFRAAVLLWCVAWHQVPAGSLPNEERELASLAGYGRDLKAWAKLRTEAMRGWYEASDRLLYHPVITEKVIEAWEAKLAQRKRTGLARLAALRKRLESVSDRDARAHLTGEIEALSQSLSQTDPKPVTESVTESKGQGQGQGQGQGGGSAREARDPKPAATTHPLARPRGPSRRGHGLRAGHHRDRRACTRAGRQGPVRPALRRGCGVVGQPARRTRGEQGP